MQFCVRKGESREEREGSSVRRQLLTLGTYRSAAQFSSTCGVLLHEPEVVKHVFISEFAHVLVLGFAHGLFQAAHLAARVIEESGDTLHNEWRLAQGAAGFACSASRALPMRWLDIAGGLGAMRQ